MITLRLCSLRTPRYFSRRGALIARNVHHATRLPYEIEEGLGEFLPPPALKAIAVDYRHGILNRLNAEVRGTEYENMTVVDTILASAGNPVDVLKFNYGSLALNNSFFLDTLKPPKKAEGEEKPENHHQSEITQQLRSNIADQYGSLAQLKSTFSAASLGMFSGGYVWLVTDKAGRLAVIPTFGAGTLLIRAREYIGPYGGDEEPSNLANLDLLLTDLRTNDPYRVEWEKEMEAETAAVDAAFKEAEEAEKAELETEQAQAEESTPAQAQEEESTPAQISESDSPFSPTSPASLPFPGGRREYHSSAPRLALVDPADSIDPSRFNASQEPASVFDEAEDIGSDEPVQRKHYAMADVLYPLLCVPVHEHAWMSAGYGVWGQEEWMKKFWTVLDWKKVSDRYSVVAPEDIDITQDSQ